MLMQINTNIVATVQDSIHIHNFHGQMEADKTKVDGFDNSSSVLIDVETKIS